MLRSLKLKNVKLISKIDIDNVSFYALVIKETKLTFRYN